MHTEGCPLHVKPGSIVQEPEHPSPVEMLPSSHVSSSWTRPFPQHWTRQACHVALKVNPRTENVPSMQFPDTSADESTVAIPKKVVNSTNAHSADPNTLPDKAPNVESTTFCVPPN
jgi:hypothetical protein